MNFDRVVRRGLLALVVSVAAAGLSACSSGGYVDNSDYVSPIAASSAPQPVVPVASAGTMGASRRLPLLPPVPEDQSSTGLPPVNMAALAPPPVH